MWHTPDHKRFDRSRHLRMHLTHRGLAPTHSGRSRETSRNSLIEAVFIQSTQYFLWSMVWMNRFEWNTHPSFLEMYTGYVWWTSVFRTIWVLWDAGLKDGMVLEAEVYEVHHSEVAVALRSSRASWDMMRPFPQSGEFDQFPGMSLPSWTLSLVFWTCIWWIKVVWYGMMAKIFKAIMHQSRACSRVRYKVTCNRALLISLQSWLKSNTVYVTVTHSEQISVS